MVPGALIAVLISGGAAIVWGAVRGPDPFCRLLRRHREPAAEAFAFAIAASTPYTVATAMLLPHGHPLLGMTKNVIVVLLLALFVYALESAPARR